MLQNFIIRMGMQPLRNHIAKNVRNYSIFQKYIYPKTTLTSNFQANKLPFSVSTFYNARFKDPVPPDYQLIYRCTMTKYVHGAQFIAIVSIIGVGILLLTEYDPKKEFKFDESKNSILNFGNVNHQLIIFLSAFTILAISTMLLIFKFPVRIYSNETTKKYIAITPGILPNKFSLIEFKAGDLSNSGKVGVLPWKQYTYKIKNGRSIILLDHYFRRPQDLNIMMGYTKGL